MNILTLQKQALATASNQRLKAHMRRLDNIALIHGYDSAKLDQAETNRVKEVRKRNKLCDCAKCCTGG
jgi:hypothetical protein